MRTLARLDLARHSPPPAPSTWVVRSVEHRLALRRVDRTLGALLGAIPRDEAGALLVAAVPARCLIDLGAALDAVALWEQGGGTPVRTDPDEARRLHTVADVARALLGQLSALTLATRAEHDGWCDQLAATLGEALDLCADPSPGARMVGA